jgi:LmbE family N-acetylglucosaminyl deacetylase
VTSGDLDAETVPAAAGVALSAPRRVLTSRCQRAGAWWTLTPDDPEVPMTVPLTELRVRAPEDVAALGTVLGVWAHPDDEAYLSAGLMALARDAGNRVVCVTATRGELGTADPARWPPGLLSAERTGEMARCLGILGVTEHHWLDHPDGGCADADPAAAIGALAELIDQVRPDTVLTFAPDGLTGHPDHRTVSDWTTAAFRRAAPASARLLYTAVEQGWADRWWEVNERLGVYLDAQPDPVRSDRLAVDLTLTGATLDRKVRALRAQTTQTAGLVAELGLAGYTEWVASEFFVAAPATS